MALWFHEATAAARFRGPDLMSSPRRRLDAVRREIEALYAERDDFGFTADQSVRYSELLNAENRLMQELNVSPEEHTTRLAPEPKPGVGIFWNRSDVD